ncbi:hypothetical protein [Crucivirus-520]|nr:hypothetical protein [Crucivirus-520]
MRFINRSSQWDSQETNQALSRSDNRRSHQEEPPTADRHLELDAKSHPHTAAAATPHYPQPSNDDDATNREPSLESNANAKLPFFFFFFCNDRDSNPRPDTKTGLIAGNCDKVPNCVIANARRST